MLIQFCQPLKCPYNVGVGKHNKDSVIGQIPMGGYIISIFAKRRELIRWKNAPQPTKSKLCIFLRNDASFGHCKGGLLIAVGVL